MSLNTLLEAAKFLELQEQEQENNQNIIEEMDIKPDVSELDTAMAAITSTPTVQPTIKTLFITSHADFNTTNLLTIAPQIKKEPATNTTATPPAQSSVAPARRVLHNSFDIINPLVIDETTGAEKRRQPPMVFRAGTREVHNKLEKHRRAHLKECFDVLKKQLPAAQDEKKTSNLSILHSALRCIQALKRRERELEHEMERLARDKIAAQQKLAMLKKEISVHYENVDFNKILPDSVPVSATPALIHEGSTTEMTMEGTEQLVAVATGNGLREPIKIPILTTKPQIALASTAASTTQVSQQPVQTTAVSVVPVGYPVSQGLVLQKLAIVPKGLTELTPLVSTHFITQQQINGKVVPLVNAQYVVKPVVVVSRPS